MIECAHDEATIKDLMEKILQVNVHEEVPHTHGSYSENCVPCQVEQIIREFWGEEGAPREYEPTLL